MHPLKPRRIASSERDAAAGGADNAQPGLPEGEARLLAVDVVGDTVVVTLDGGITLELDRRSAPDPLPEPGQLVPAGLVAHMARAQARKLAARDLMKQLDRRLQPVAKLRRKLLEHGHDPEAIEEVLHSMQEKGLCSDRLYAEVYCRDTLRAKPVGPRYLVARLRSHQVPSAVAQRVVAEVLDSAQEQELAWVAAAARWKRAREPHDRAALAKVIRFVIGRGFSPSVAHAAARGTWPDAGDEGASE